MRGPPRVDILPSGTCARLRYRDQCRLPGDEPAPLPAAQLPPARHPPRPGDTGRAPRRPRPAAAGRRRRGPRFRARAVGRGNGDARHRGGAPPDPGRPGGHAGVRPGPATPRAAARGGGDARGDSPRSLLPRVDRAFCRRLAVSRLQPGRLERAQPGRDGPLHVPHRAGARLRGPARGPPHRRADQPRQHRRPLRPRRDPGPRPLWTLRAAGDPLHRLRAVPGRGHERHRLPRAGADPRGAGDAPDAPGDARHVRRRRGRRDGVDDPGRNHGSGARRGRRGALWRPVAGLAFFVAVCSWCESPSGARSQVRSSAAAA